MEWIPGAAALTIWSPEPAAVVAGAAAGGGVRGGDGPEGEEREGGVLEDQHLTVSAIKWSGKAGEDEWRRGGARRLGRPRGRKRMVRGNGSVPVRFLARGWSRGHGGDGGGLRLARGGLKRRRFEGGRRWPWRTGSDFQG